jgi:C-terminal peptidase prc
VAPSPSPAPTLAPLAFREEIFEKVWSKVDEQYLYDDFRGLDWPAVYETYAPQVRRAASNDEFYALLSSMVRELDDGHSRFIAPSQVLVEDAENTGVRSSVGVGILSVALDDGAFVQQVFPGSPAERAGIRPRDRIVAVNAQPYNPTDSQLEGPEGTTVTLTIARPGSPPFTVTLKRQMVQGRIAPQTRRFDGDIGYLSIPTLWVNDMSSQVAGALTDLVAGGELNGVIIDLRGNRGGWREVLTSILGHFVRGRVGAFFNQRELTPLIVEPAPGPDLSNVPLVVLIDERSASYAEVLAGVLQERGRARVVGETSAGNTETAYGYDFEDGSRLWVAQEGFRLANGANLEGSGVQPDIRVVGDWTRFSEEQDPFILAALALLRQQL